MNLEINLQTHQINCYRRKRTTNGVSPYWSINLEVNLQTNQTDCSRRVPGKRYATHILLGIGDGTAYITSVPCTTDTRKPVDAEQAMPSSRKTTTEASAIISSASPLDDHSRVKISHVCYDDYIHEAHRRISCAPLKSGLSLEGEEEDEEKGDQEKQENTCVVDVTNTEDNRDTEKAPQTESSVAGDTDGAKWWHGGRRDAMAVIENLAGGGRTAVATDTRSTFDFVTEGEGWVDGMGEGTLLHVVLADDNMHFRSMRHEVLQVARTCEKCGCGHPSRVVSY